MLRRKYTEKCDIWSCGVILYILLCGYPPFNGENDKVIMDKVAAGKYEFSPEEWSGISEEAKKLIKKMMEYDPNNRYSAEQALNDPWFKRTLGDGNFDKPLALSALNNLKQFRVSLNVFLYPYSNRLKESFKKQLGSSWLVTCRIKKRKLSL